MSEVDRLSNSGLYPALPVSGIRRGNGSSRKPPGEPHDQGAESDADDKSAPDAPRPPKSIIDEYA
jgi:hypothetical protein